MNLTQDEITAIAVLHKKLDAFLRRPTFYVDAKDVARVIEGLEYACQVCWGFPLDKDFHRYWFTVEGCTCPKLDNKDYITTNYRIYATDCPYHGNHYD